MQAPVRAWYRDSAAGSHRLHPRPTLWNAVIKRAEASGSPCLANDSPCWHSPARIKYKTPSSAHQSRQIRKGIPGIRRLRAGIHCSRLTAPTVEQVLRCNGSTTIWSTSLANSSSTLSSEGEQWLSVPDRGVSLPGNRREPAPRYRCSRLYTARAANRHPSR